MTVPTAVLVFTAIVLLAVGVVTGVAMSRVRLGEPETPKYLRYAHLAAYGQAPLLLGIAWLLGFSSMSSGFDLTTAAVVSLGAGLLVAKDLVNWLSGTVDEFREQDLGYRIGAVFGVVHAVGVGMVAVVAISAI